MSKLIALCTAALLALAGCAHEPSYIRQEVHPVASLPEMQICIIEAPRVRPSFLTAYEHALAVRGYAVRQLAPDAPVTACRVTTTYRALWRWDVVLYMTIAQIHVFVDGHEAGDADYDATHGAYRGDRFIDADKKIVELVGLLLPAGPAQGQEPAAPAASAASAASGTMP